MLEETTEAICNVETAYLERNWAAVGISQPQLLLDFGGKRSYGEMSIAVVKLGSNTIRLKPSSTGSSSSDMVDGMGVDGEATKDIKAQFSLEVSKAACADSALYLEAANVGAWTERRRVTMPTVTVVQKQEEAEMIACPGLGGGTALPHATQHSPFPVIGNDHVLRGRGWCRNLSLKCAPPPPTSPLSNFPCS